VTHAIIPGLIAIGGVFRILVAAAVPEKRFAAFGPFRSGPSTWAAGEFRTEKIYEIFWKIAGEFWAPGWLWGVHENTGNSYRS